MRWHNAARSLSDAAIFKSPNYTDIRHIKSLPPRGRWHAKRDGRSLRNDTIQLNYPYTHSPSVAKGDSSLPEGAS